MNESTEHKLNQNDIVSYVKEATLTCYGVSSVLSVESSKKGMEEDAIYVVPDKDGTFSLDIHVSVMEGVKVTETIRSLQKTVRFYMNRLYPKKCTKINIYADEIASNK